MKKDIEIKVWKRRMLFFMFVETSPKSFNGLVKTELLAFLDGLNKIYKEGGVFMRP